MLRQRSEQNGNKLKQQNWMPHWGVRVCKHEIKTTQISYWKTWILSKYVEKEKKKRFYCDAICCPIISIHGRKQNLIAPWSHFTPDHPLVTCFRFRLRTHHQQTWKVWGSKLCVCMALALMRVFLGVSLCLLLFSQEEGWPGDQSVLKAHTGPICHQWLALAAHSSSIRMICETRGCI